LQTITLAKQLATQPPNDAPMTACKCFTPSLHAHRINKNQHITPRHSHSSSNVSAARAMSRGVNCVSDVSAIGNRRITKLVEMNCRTVCLRNVLAPSEILRSHALQPVSGLMDSGEVLPNGAPMLLAQMT
jgi:hypothetical protein